MFRFLVSRLFVIPCWIHCCPFACCCCLDLWSVRFHWWPQHTHGLPLYFGNLWETRKAHNQFSRLIHANVATKLIFWPVLRAGNTSRCCSVHLPWTTLYHFHSRCTIRCKRPKFMGENPWWNLNIPPFLSCCGDPTPLCDNRQGEWKHFRILPFTRF